MNLLFDLSLSHVLLLPLCILHVPAKLEHPPLLPTSSSVITWLPARMSSPSLFPCPNLVLICDSAQVPCPPGIFLCSYVVNSECCGASISAGQMLYCLCSPQWPLISLPLTVHTRFLPCIPCPLFAGKLCVVQILYSHLSA